MKYLLVILTTFVATIGLSTPVMAQIRTPSQDFFEQGRVQLERELQILQGQTSESPQDEQKPESKPLLEVAPTPSSDTNQKPNQGETPQEKPNQQINNTPEN